ncbi:MazG family protein [Haloechinothrix halophila]|uniref:MazG family protein n=1 Tax=Haloechinothrix halophila TaxID=1069073 RepID=UPI0003FAC169|nr:MazG family protein [Haloechinothrix halophila]
MTSTPHPGCAVVLLSAAYPTLPANAIPTVRAADALYAAADIDESVALAAGAKPAPEQAVLLAEAARGVVVLLAAQRTEPAAAALAEAGVLVIEPELPPLLRAVAVMDRLRSPGGCPWDAEQTHDSLRQYLIEETYELLDAIETRDRPALLEELGDVLLQVLFHARLAAEDADEPFDIDDVAEELVDKLVGRHPHVFADAERVHTAERQQHRWEELKQQEKQRESIVDGVALGQPATALAAKLASRTGRANLPAELFPRGDDVGQRLFRAVAEAKRAGAEPEGELREAARAFAADVKAAEAAARADDVDPATLDAAGWRRYWPR